MRIRSIRWASVCLLWGLLLFGSSLQAQLIHRDGDDGAIGDANDAIVMDFEKGGRFDPYCLTDLVLSVKVANLASSPVIGQSYSLPSSVPSLYFAVDVQGLLLSTSQVHSFIFKGEYRRGIPIFEAQMRQTIDYGGLCAGAISRMNCTIRLQTSDGSPYPVDDNTGLRDIFSCDAFNFPTCSRQRDRTNSDNIVFNRRFGVDCGLCIDHPGIIDHRSSSNVQEAQEIQLQFSPNPFQTQLSVQLTSQRVHTLSLRVLDVSGKQVHAAQVAPDAADNYTINASQWGKGLYFFQVDSGDAVKTHKLIKSQ
ncbi:MAG: T9SS type A sorting domain-containing protein [Bacteroidota bacterium]